MCNVQGDLKIVKYKTAVCKSFHEKNNKISIIKMQDYLNKLLKTKKGPVVAF